MSDNKLAPEFWENFLRAAEVEPRSERTISGASGLIHPVLCLGVDDRRGRLILVSADQDARAAALMQADVQATLAENLHVVVARPVAINLANAAKELISKLGGLSSINMIQLGELAKDEENLRKMLEPIFEPYIRAYKSAPMNALSQVIQVIQQIAIIDFQLSRLADESDAAPKRNAHSKQKTAKSSKAVEGVIINLSPLASTDFMAMDRNLGVCPIPLYELSESQLDSFLDEKNDEAARKTLVDLGVMQFFFRAPIIRHWD